ncbi:MAG TPA: hypothetical protein VH184_07195 [Dongiaceae bacterium]|nr:hypothetical protein [Dongiaceae bacterium]
MARIDAGTAGGPAPEAPSARHSLGHRIVAKLLEEFRHILPPTIYFFLGFNLVLLTKRLMLEQYLIQFTGFFIATTSALIVGKAVLVADMMPFLKRFDHEPLAKPILFKTIVYTFLVFVVRLIEAMVHYFAAGGHVGGFIAEQAADFSWPRFIATQLWIFILFLGYVTGRELNYLLGDGELRKIMFTRPSTKLKRTRRERIRLLVRLGKLTQDHGVEELTDRRSPAYAELAGILRRLAS